jgi:uncharacterized protein (TIGR02118 family)
MKLVALYREPEDKEAFEAAYFDAHLPLIEQVPGLLRTKVTRFTRTIVGDGLYMMAEMYFTDGDALKNAMRSEEMAAAGENLDSFAKGLYSLHFADPEDEKEI